MAVDAGGVVRPMFTGHALSASSLTDDSDAMHIEASGMTGFSERKSPRMATWGSANIDILYMLARTSGLAADEVVINMDQGPSHEVYEVAVPVESATVDTPIRTGSVALLPLDLFGTPRSLGSGASPASDLLAQFEGSGVVAVTYVCGAMRMFDAESEGLTRIKDAAAWLRVGNAFAGSRWPDGTARAFQREAMRARLGIAPYVLVKGLLSRRAWLRSLEAPPGMALADLARAGSRIFEPPAALGGRLAVLSAARAADESVLPMERVNALWEGIEFLVSATKPPKMFSRAERKAIKKAIPTTLTSDQAARIEDMVGNLNHAPLFAKLRFFTESLRIPVSAGEFDLLHSLRAIRNEAVHGRGVAEPTGEDLALAASILARLILFSTPSARFQGQADG